MLPILFISSHDNPDGSGDEVGTGADDCSTKAFFYTNVLMAKVQATGDVVSMSLQQDKKKTAIDLARYVSLIYQRQYTKE